jgi:hypothetical protein
MMNKEANEIIEAAGHNYDHASANLQTLATLYSLPGKYDHEEVQRQKDQLDLIKTRRELIEKQNADSDMRLAIQAKDQGWLDKHPEAHGVVPDAIHAQHHGEAEREYKGTVGAAQMFTDPGSGTTFTMVPGHPETAQTLTGEPFTPTGAVKVGTKAPAAPADPKTIEFYANMYKRTGAFPPSLGRDEQGRAIMRAALDQIAKAGTDPGDIIVSSGTLKADEASLKKMQAMADASVSFENTALANFDLALTLAPNAIPTELGPIFNRWIERGEVALGDKDVPKYAAALITAANEYAKIMTGATGAAGSTVDSRREAYELFSQYLSLGSIREVVEVARKDMQNREDQLYGQIERIKRSIRTGEPRARSEPGPAPTSPPAAGGTTLKYDAQGNRIP